MRTERLGRTDLRDVAEIGRTHPDELLSIFGSFLEKTLAKESPENGSKFVRVRPESAA